MLVDLHAHTKEISLCCRISSEEAIKTAKDLGYDGIVVTNHYTRGYFNDDSYDAWIEKYIDEWEHCRELGLKYQLKIFCGIEVTIEEDPRLHILIYGADNDFLRNHQRLCDKTIEELYGICKEEGCTMVQAHPFRGGTTVQNTDFLDGIEINCHPLYNNSYSKEILEIAKNNNLAVTVGCDYHGDTYRPKGGMILPDWISTDRELAQYIIDTSEFSLQIHEPNNDKIFNTVVSTK